MITAENHPPNTAPADPRRTKATRFQGQAMAEYLRILEFYGLKTQQQLADLLGIRQSSVSDALKRSNEGLPATWKLALLKSSGLSPIWVETGLGAACMAYAGKSNDPPEKTPLVEYSTSELLAELNRRAAK